MNDPQLLVLARLVDAGATAPERASSIRDLGLQMPGGTLAGLRWAGLIEKEGDQRARYRAAHLWWITREGRLVLKRAREEYHAEKAAAARYCPRCEGWGALALDGFPDCPACRGTGVRPGG